MSAFLVVTSRDLAMREKKKARLGQRRTPTRHDSKKSRDGWPMRRGHVMPDSADTAIGYGLNWANVSNTPFRMYKITFTRWTNSLVAMA